MIETRSSRAARRLFVCDPACVQPFGHNVTALRYFKLAFSDRYDSVHALCCRDLPADVIKREGFTPDYRFYYEPYFPSVKVSVPLSLTTWSETSLYVLDPLEAVATQDAVKMLETYAIGVNDDILFPHLDFYGVVGILNALARLPANSRPRLLLRFIGVMENATDVYRSPYTELMTRVKIAIDSGQSIELGAETPRYADVLARKLGKPVTVLGYPDESEQMPLPRSGPFYFYCPGSARADKGFFELFEIFSSVRRRDPELDIRFVSQILAKSDLKHHGVATSALYALPGVELQPSAISSAEMVSTFKRTHAVMLPYATDIYDLRGSAVLMEATAFGRPVISYAGTAFAELVQHYKLGILVNNRAEFVDAAFEMAARDRDDLEIEAMQARHRFRNDNVSSYDAWMTQK